MSRILRVPECHRCSAPTKPANLCWRLAKQPPTNAGGSPNTPPTYADGSPNNRWLETQRIPIFCKNAHLLRHKQTNIPNIL
ncbi:MAG: hypothetical protein ACRCUY_00885 [Thermoguttaceae bacterium]